MFIATNIIILITTLLTSATLQSFAVWHAVSLITTLPAGLAVLFTTDDMGAIVDILLTVAMSVVIAFLFL